MRQSPDTGTGGKEARVSHREHSSICRPFLPCRPTPSLFSKTRQEKEKRGDASCSELKMLEMGVDPVDDGERIGIPLSQFSEPSKRPVI